MDLTTIKAHLAGIPIPEIRFFNSITSTNDFALAWAETNAPDMALIIADEQTAGRGRFSRRWLTPPGAALAFSLVIRPSTSEQTCLPLFSPFTGLVISLAIEEITQLKPQLKYPNDILLAGKKCAGILVEAAWQGNQLKAAVIGAGVNVMHHSTPPPGEVLFPATSLEEETGFPLQREELLATILRHFFSWRSRLGTDEFMAAWDQRLAFRGKTVSISLPSGMILSGTVQGIDQEGALLLQLNSGDIRRITIGDVHLRPS